MCVWCACAMVSVRVMLEKLRAIHGTHEVIMWSARGFDHKSLVFGRRQLSNLLQSSRATCVRARKC